jgi:hypothetical protein
VYHMYSDVCTLFKNGGCRRSMAAVVAHSITRIIVELPFGIKVQILAKII